MNHFNEHILEMYVLGSGMSSRDRTAIETHLKGCDSCRAIAEEMRLFHGEARDFYREHPDGIEVAPKALSRSRTDLMPLFDAPPVPAHMRSRGAQRVWEHVQRHRVASTAGGILIFGGLVLLAGLLTGPFMKGRTIASFKYDPLDNTIEVMNARDEVLWKKPSEDIRHVIDSEQAYNLRKTILVNQELATVIPLWDARINEYGPRLRVFTAAGDLRFERDLDRPIHYGQRTYSSRIYGDGLLATPASDGRSDDICVASCNNRSPFYLGRFSGTGEVLGEYWHFGFIPRISRAMIAGEQRPCVVLSGVNDTEDSTAGSYPVVVVLDPSKLEGVHESSATRGFGYSTTAAELYYIRLPRTDIADALRSSESVMFRIPGDSAAIRFYVNVPQGVGLEYVFGTDMRVREVKPYSGFERARAVLVEQGKLRSDCGPAYFEDLKRGVRYWDGEVWREDVTRVRHR